MNAAQLLNQAADTGVATGSLDVKSAIVIGAAGSLVASLVWLVSLRLLRPKLEVAATAACIHNSDGVLVYRVKIVNRSLFPAVNVKIEVAELERVTGKGGHKDLKVRLATRPSELVVLPRFKPLERKKDPPSEFAFRFTIPEALHDIVRSPHKRVRVRVYAEHPISRVVRTFEQTFSEAAQLEVGDYEIGKSMKIVPADPAPFPPPTIH